MSIPPELDATLEARWATIEPNAPAIVGSPESTIEPSLVGPDTQGERALELLRGLGVENATGTPVQIGRTLAEGGMGIVRLAHQVSVGREVAVKTLRDEQIAPGAVMRLLREAWVTGRLEHPNVVPVYDVAIDGTGRPQVVLKRIEGMEWGALMHDAAAVRDRFGVHDLLLWNVDVLRQVCDAVHFAHSRGIVHRDIKPENVMIGEFGEVYVVDWGIAVSLQDDGQGRLPLARDATELAGTPAYMAPEMLGGDAPPITERTDVYLLGATLYEIVAGVPPHRGEKLVEIMSSVVLSRPDLPLTVPTELGAICRRAMAANPDERFESARELRMALDEFGRHRESMRLVESAQSRLNELLDELREADPAHEGDQRLYNLFGECRFGFRAALDAWPENEAAQGALRLAAISFAEYELERGDPKAAQTLVADVSDPPPGLLERIARLHQRKEREIEKLRALEADMDPRAGSRTRTFLAAVMGALWSVTPGIAYLVGDGSLPSYDWSVIVALAFIAVALALGYWARESLMKTRVNRGLYAVVILALAAQLILRGGAWLAQLPVADTMAFHFFLWFSMVCTVCIFVDRRFIPAASGYLLGFFLVSAHPELVLPMMSVSNFVLTLNVIWIWAPMFRWREPGPRSGAS